MGTPITGADTEVDGDESILRRAPRLHETDVFTVADQLLVTGQRPSVDRVRLQLGRGSPNTIALFLDRWWRQLGARLRDLPGQELPGLPKEVTATVTMLWTQAIDHARGLLQDTLAQQSAQLTAEHEQLTQRSTHLETQQAELKKERESLHHTVDLAQSQLQEANERQRADRHRLTELQAELSQKQAQLEHSRTQQNELATKLETALQQHQQDVRALNERIEGTERHWLKEIDDTRQALSAERKASQALERQRGQEQAKLAEELRQAQVSISGLTAELGRTRDQLTETKTQRTHIEGLLTEQIARADRAVEVMQTVQTQAAQQVDDLQRQLKETMGKSIAKLGVRKARGATDHP